LKGGYCHDPTFFSANVRRYHAPRALPRGSPTSPSAFPRLKPRVPSHSQRPSPHPQGLHADDWTPRALPTPNHAAGSRGPPPARYKANSTLASPLRPPRTLLTSATPRQRTNATPRATSTTPSRRSRNAHARHPSPGWHDNTTAARLTHPSTNHPLDPRADRLRQQRQPRAPASPAGHVDDNGPTTRAFDARRPRPVRSHHTTATTSAPCPDAPQRPPPNWRLGTLRPPDTRDVNPFI
jgi:hypothetical protein